MKGFSVATVGIFLLRLPGMLQCDKPLFARCQRYTERQTARERGKLMKENPRFQIVAEITFSCEKAKTWLKQREKARKGITSRKTCSSGLKKPKCLDSWAREAIMK